MTSNVSFQFAELNARVIALGTLVRLFVRVSIADMSHQLTGCGEGAVAELADVRLIAGVSVVMIG